jgi:ABC-type Fe3+ transport system permease subunit
MSGRLLRLRHFVPLVGFLVPTVVIGYGVVIPTSCIAGVNELTVGFAGSIVGAAVTYWMGLRSVLRERGRVDEA